MVLLYQNSLLSVIYQKSMLSKYFLGSFLYNQLQKLRCFLKALLFSSVGFFLNFVANSDLSIMAFLIALVISGSNNRHFCAFHLCNKLWRSLEPLWWKGQKKSKKHLFWTLNPLYSVIKIFQIIYLAKIMGTISLYADAKIRKILRAVLEKRTKKSKNTFFGHLIPINGK